ncbi:SIR2 family protein [Cryobacterium sp. TMT3-29-2]|uniref:SIR2 family protein n=1 Tax=Cryobacterium sp. TMT3-29-2 TaxID=2555867 RepID=UPI0010749287|nr:SIR2 family protein [Cryobacterium sp. TMT3-29-2]TFC93546.1 hypothetical protein E3O67_01560 [Cryobacterium sp. TMT3-29-2]
MRFTADVDVPEELVSASLDGSLVLFVGAGVSKNAPSNLPLFTGLASQVAELHGETFNEEEMPADAYLGRLIDREPIAREQARGILGSPASLHNKTHTAIARLVSNAAKTRLVTTNFDEHLTHAAIEAGIDLGDRFNGPAVPLAREFSGIVHLHGTVLRPANELVLTDGDFGRAYLTDGWARRFVQELFLNRVVLFIGYSHDDTVMKYLARGLPPTTGRYVLTDIGAHPKWTDLHVTPVQYPADNDHEALTQALDAWSDRLAMGHLDHRSRVKTIVGGGPPKTPVDEDYLRSAINTPVGVRAFADEATGRDWLSWAEQQPAFVALFSANGLASDSSQELAQWFARNYLRDESSVQLAFGTIARLGPVASHALMQALSFGAYHLRQFSPALSVRVSTIISASLQTDDVAPGHSWTIIHRMPLDSASVMPFLRRAVLPRLVLAEARSWLASPNPDESPTIAAKIVWSSSEPDVKVMLEAAHTDFEAVAVNVLHAFEQALRDGYELLKSFKPDSTWDSWSFSRSAIEPDAQNSMRNFENTLIDGLRDASVLLGASDSSHLTRWLKDPLPIFRRLAVHALTEDAQLDSNDKVDLLLSAVSVYDHQTKHEIFRFLAKIVPHLDIERREKLLNRLLEGPPPFDFTDGERFHRQGIFDILEWLTRHVADWPELLAAVDAILLQEPGMSAHPHPDFDHFMTSGVWGGTLPFEVDEFVELIGSSGAEAAMSALLNRDYSERDFDQPSWDDALSLVRQVVEKNPDLGADLIAAPSGDHQTDIAAAVVRGWATGTLSDSELETATSRVELLSGNSDLALAIAEFALGAVDHKIDSRPAHELIRLDQICRQLWEQNVEAFDHPDTDDWMSVGLNTWPGFIAQYWVNRIRLRWRASRDDWDGLSDDERAALSDMLGTATAAGHGPLAIIASEVFFLYAADPAYAKQEVFPRFDSVNAAHADQAWTSFLYRARLDDRMLDDGFWELLLKASTLAPGAIDSRVQGQYWQLLASIATQSSASSVDRPGLIDFLAAGEVADLASFFDALAYALSELDSAEAMRVWETWLREIVRLRSELLPGSLSSFEKAAWGDLALRCGPAVVDALTLTEAIPGPLGAKTTFDDLSEELSRANANLIAHAVRQRTLLTPNPDFHVAYELEELVGKLQNAGADPAEMRELVEAAIGIGIHRASQWLGL